MASNAGENALQQLLRFTRIDGAASLVREGNHSIHVREIAFELFGAEPIANVM